MGPTAEVCPVMRVFSATGRTNPPCGGPLTTEAPATILPPLIIEVTVIVVPLIAPKNEAGSTPALILLFSTARVAGVCTVMGTGCGPVPELVNDCETGGAYCGEVVASDSPASHADPVPVWVGEPSADHPVCRSLTYGSITS